jgi:hypothetical protein
MTNVAHIIWWIGFSVHVQKACLLERKQDDLTRALQYQFIPEKTYYPFWLKVV